MRHLLIILSSSIALISCTIKIEEDDDPSYKILPLIFITHRSCLRPPDHVKMEITQLGKLKSEFYSSLYNDVGYFCPAHSSKKRKIVKEIANGAYNLSKRNNPVSDQCLVRKSPSYWQRFKTENPRCAEEPEPVITKIFHQPEEENREVRNFQGDLQEIVCGPEGRVGIEYRFGYQICIPKSLKNYVTNYFATDCPNKPFPYEEVIDFEIFRFCYDNKAKEVVYTKHAIQSPSLLFVIPLRTEQKVTYPMNSSGYDLFGSEFERLAEIYKTIDDLRDLEKLPPFKTQKLIPPDDMSFATWRKPTFHYANVDLMHKNLQSYWNHVNDALRYNAKQGDMSFTIYSGAFRLYPSTAEHVITIKGIQVPEIWVKIVQFHITLQVVYGKNKFEKRRRAVAFIANNYLHKDISRLIRKFYCEEDLCTEFAKEKFPEVYQYVSCCPVTPHLSGLFGIEVEFDEVIQIAGFIEKSKLNSEIETND